MTKPITIKNTSPYCHLEIGSDGGDRHRFHLVVGGQFYNSFDAEVARHIHGLLGQALDEIDRRKRQSDVEKRRQEAVDRQKTIIVDGHEITVQYAPSGEPVSAWLASHDPSTAPWLVVRNLHAKARCWYVKGPAYQRWPGETPTLRREDPSRYSLLESAINLALVLARTDKLPKPTGVRTEAL